MKLFVFRHFLKVKIKNLKWATGALFYKPEVGLVAGECYGVREIYQSMENKGS
jgi:hypothetical protein